MRSALSLGGLESLDLWLVMGLVMKWAGEVGISDLFEVEEKARCGGERRELERRVDDGDDEI